jgi:hypothetical protein
MRALMTGPGRTGRIAVWAITIACCFIVVQVVAQKAANVDDLPFMNPDVADKPERVPSLEPLQPQAPVPGFTPSNVNVSNPWARAEFWAHEYILHIRRR